jgi:hypothetical protein
MWKALQLKITYWIFLFLKSKPVLLTHRGDWRINPVSIRSLSITKHGVSFLCGYKEGIRYINITMKDVIGIEEERYR